MNEPEAGRRVARLLDRGLDDIDQGILNRLQIARRAALEGRQVAESAVVVGSDGSLGSRVHWTGGGRTLLTALMLLLVLMGALYWQTLQQSDENEEIEIMLLADDLPIDAYLDDELDSWLNHS